MSQLIGACEHGHVVHYRYPCRKCLGWRGYIVRKTWATWNDTRYKASDAFRRLRNLFKGW